MAESGVMMAARVEPGAGIAFTEKAGVAKLIPVQGLARFVFRGESAAEAKAGAALGLAFPALNRFVSKGGRGEAGARFIARIGPDETFIIVPEAEGAAVAAAISQASAGEPMSLVDVGHRQIGLVLAGPQAAGLLNSGCPLDLDLRAFPVGMATRTLFHKAEIMLWRMDEATFRIEVWRSFLPYLAGMMAEGAKDFA